VLLDAVGLSEKSQHIFDETARNIWWRQIWRFVCHALNIAGRCGSQNNFQ
jgi:hypothetical protein